MVTDAKLLARLDAVERRLDLLDEGKEVAPAAPRIMPAAPAIEEGSRLIYPSAGIPRGLPVEAEFIALRRVVDLAYPRLAFMPKGQWADQEKEDLEGFRIGFAYLATLARTDKLATKYAASWWLTGAEAWANDLSLPSTIPGRAFVAALVAISDIDFSDLSSYPSFGLAIGDGGRRYDPRHWRELLQTGRVRQPVADTGKPRLAPPSPSGVNAPDL